MTDGILIRTLSPQDIRGQLGAFLAIAGDQPDEYWTEIHFLTELPEKWSLSFAAWRDDKPVAYAILSRKAAEVVHLHHFMVKAGVRGRGLGARMLGEMAVRARTAGASRLTLKVATTNDAAVRFYRRGGFSETDILAGYRLLERAI